MRILRDGYVGIAPVPRGRVNVGIVLGRSWRRALAEAGAQHVNLQGLVHGGMIATLADTAMGLAVRTVLENGRRHVTVQLGIEFLSPGRPGRIVAHGRSVKIGRQLGFAEADIVDSRGRLLALARSTLSVTREKS